MQRGGGYRRREPLALEETQEKFIAAAAGLGVSRDLWWSVECLLWRCGVGHRRWMLMFTGEITASINEWNEGVIKEARRQDRWDFTIERIRRLFILIETNYVHVTLYS